MKCKGHEKIERGYLEASDHADEQLKKGIQQVQCPICKLWIWPNDFFRNIAPPKVKDKVIKAWACIKSGEIKLMWKQKTLATPIPCTITIKHADYDKLRRKC